MSESDDQFTEEDIAAVAKQMWEEEGRPEGKAEEHWKRAKEHLSGNGSGGEYVRAPDKDAGIHG